MTSCRIRPLDRKAFTKGQRKLLLELYRMKEDQLILAIGQATPLFLEGDRKLVAELQDTLARLRAVFRRIAPQRRRAKA